MLILCASPAAAGRRGVFAILTDVLRGLGSAVRVKVDNRGVGIRLANAGSVVQVVVALAIALVAAPMVRTVTYVMTDTVGRTWPFSIARCRPTTRPDCPVAPDYSTVAPHVRTGRL